MDWSGGGTVTGLAGGGGGVGSPGGGVDPTGGSVLLMQCSFMGTNGATGVGRTGSLYAYMQYGVTPDILTTAKALGNGFPIGAMLTTDDIAAHFKVGVHGTTYGGNPLGASIAEKVVELISDPKLLEGVTQRSEAIKAHLARINERFSLFKEIRGTGLLIGAELADAYKDRAKDVLNAAAANGVPAGCANRTRRRRPGGGSCALPRECAPGRRDRRSRSR